MPSAKSEKGAPEIVSGNDFIILTIMIMTILFLLLNLGPLIFF